MLSSLNPSNQRELTIPPDRWHPADPKYPGLGLPLRHDRQDNDNYPLGAHGNCFGSQSFILPIRELAMMSVMERLTDKENWHNKVFDEDIVSKWRNEALAIPDEEFWSMAFRAKEYRGIDAEDEEDGGYVDGYWHSHDQGIEGILDDATFDFCIQELQAKARYYDQTGIIPTLDACASVAKSDILVPQSLQDSLHTAFSKLKRDQEDNPDWHPNTNGMVQDLVHPSMYPLVYGRSRGFKEEVVGVDDAIEKWMGKGEVIPKENRLVDDDPFGVRYGIGGGMAPPEYWSDTYQWLPANVAFQDDGTVKFTSYINNLHPKKYPDIYRTIEKLIQTALPLWDQCLKTIHGDGAAGRTASRFPFPHDADDDIEENWIPSDKTELAHIEVELTEEELEMVCMEEVPTEEEILECKWRRLRKPRNPVPENHISSYLPPPGERLVNKFKDMGLQIIVKMASIELTPEKPEFPVGGWHVEGQMNERICATALYYLDNENISPSSLSFRMQTSPYINEDIDVGQENYKWLEFAYGTTLGGGNSPCLQNYGTVETKQGRLLAFPNVFQHRVSPFRLQDPTKPGHRRFIALWLVDPSHRIISTANVPPQQSSWYMDSILGPTPASRDDALKKLPAELVALLMENGFASDISPSSCPELPPELMNMVREHFGASLNSLPMTAEEAKKHRDKLMEERGAFHQTAENGWQQHSYSFCEH